MGFVLKNYDQLRILAFGDQKSQSFVELEKELQQFRLFVFILNNERPNSSFTKYLQDRFSYMDERTGGHLLFFSVVDPDKTWLARAQRRSYYSTLRSLVEADTVLRSREPVATAYTLAAALGIPTSQLPCLVITDSLRSPYFLRIQTSEHELTRQMFELDYVATKSEPAPTDSTSASEYRRVLFERIQKSIGSSPDHIAEQSLDETLVKVLTDALSLIVSSDNTAAMMIDSSTRRDAKEQANIVVERILQLVTNAKTSGSLTDEAFDEICVKAASYLAMTRVKGRVQDPNLITQIRSLIEADSLHFLRTGNAVMASLDTTRHHESESLAFDYSPVVVSFAKAYEREINLSVVQWIRAELGVEMPTYFDTWKPGFRAPFSNKDFNRSRDGAWIPPGLGDSYYAFQEMLDRVSPRHPPYRRAINSVRLASLWKQLYEKRNAAAHPKALSRQDAVEFVGYLQAIADEGFFQAFHEIKQSCRLGIATL